MTYLSMCMEVFHHSVEQRFNGIIILRKYDGRAKSYFFAQTWFVAQWNSKILFNILIFIVLFSIIKLTINYKYYTILSHIVVISFVKIMYYIMFLFIHAWVPHSTSEFSMQYKQAFLRSWLGSHPLTSLFICRAVPVDLIQERTAYHI